jgi:DNA-binding CsgD family transcriptional regulator
LTGSQLRARKKTARSSTPLLERDAEIAVLKRQLDRLSEGSGAAIVIQAPWGNGKSRLLAAARDLARDAGADILRARGTKLEEEYPFGLATQLLEPAWIATAKRDRARLGDGPARWGQALLEGTLPEDDPDWREGNFPVVHGLFRLTANLAGSGADARRPLALLVDDAHLADRASLSFLAYLASRLAKLPILLAVAVGAGEPSTDAATLASLTTAVGADVLRPQRLTLEAAKTIVETSLPGADPVFSKACAHATGGNPFLVTELVELIRREGFAPDATTAAQASELVPESVQQVVQARLDALSPEVSEIARAVAIYGDGASLRRVALLAGLDTAPATQAADALAELELLDPGEPLRFARPLVGAAVRASMPSLERGQAHRLAARILRTDHASDEAVAAHLLLAPAAADPRAVEVLRSAARTSAANGAADDAVRLLRRAIEEGPPADVYPDLMYELAHAETRAGLAEASQSIDDAMGVAREPGQRARLALLRSSDLRDQGEHADAARILRSVIDRHDLGDADLVDDLEAAYMASALAVPELRAEARASAEMLMSQVDGNATPNQRAAIAHAAVHDAVRNERREAVRAMADLAWGKGALLAADGPGGSSWPLVSRALLVVDELERAIEICDDASAAADELDSPAGAVNASYCRAWPLYEQGRIAEALADAEAAVDARPDVSEISTHTGYGAIAAAHIQRGELDGAERALSSIEDLRVRQSAHLPFLLEIRAQLRLEQLQPQEALSDATEAGRLWRARFGVDTPGALPCRTTAALAHIALGDAERARVLAAEELDQARKSGVTRGVVRALRVLGLADEDDRGLDLLDAAVQAGANYPLRLEHILALVEYGAALRRANQRGAARAPLRQALELAHAGGATAIARRAKAELEASGARSRAALLFGMDALTPSERRVAELAARGLTTRQMSEMLFVTSKTIEFHLRNIYRKLNVGSREDLAGALAESAT